jgi:hypothetical protein
MRRIVLSLALLLLVILALLVVSFYTYGANFMGGGPSETVALF